MVRVLVKIITCGEYLNIKTCLCKKRLFGKLVLACRDEILNATETLINNKKETCEKKMIVLLTRFHQ